MPLKLYKRGEIWHYRGTVAGRRLRGSTGTSSKENAARIASEIDGKEWKCRFDGPQAVLTFAQAAMLYRSAGKPVRFLERVEDYWKDTLVKDITAGAIRQSALTIYPKVSGATRNRQVIVPTQAIINHASESDLCPRIKVKRFKVETKIKVPATLEWVQALMAHSEPHVGGLALFMFLTGARISEAVRLRWTDVDLKARTAKIGQRKVGNERLAHLPPPLVVALANMPREPGKPVFLYTNRTSSIKPWYAAIEAAGIEPLSFHSCRHGLATALLQAGVDPITTAMLGGWKTPRHVFETYGHASDDTTLTDKISGTKSTQPTPKNARKPYKTGTS